MFGVAENAKKFKIEEQLSPFEPYETSAIQMFELAWIKLTLVESNKNRLD